MKSVVAHRKDLSKTVEVNGYLEIKDNLKIGSLVAGVVQQVNVQEGSVVAKGEILATINNGKDDCDLLACSAEVEQATAALEYQSKHLERLEALLAANALAKDEFEQEQCKKIDLACRLKIAKARLKKASMEYENSKIRAPKDGVIVAVRVTPGEAVTVSLDATVLFELASNLDQKQAVFEVDEADISWVAVGQSVLLENPGPINERLTAKISSISLTPRIKAGTVFFKVFADLDDPGQMLRAGTSVSGDIVCRQSESALCLPVQSFCLPLEVVQQLAEALHWRVVKKSYDKRKTQLKTVWKVVDECIEQQTVVVGISDGIDAEVVSGLEGNEQVLIDIDEVALAAMLQKQR